MERIPVSQGAYPVLLIATMTALIQDLSPVGGGAQAWMYHYSTDPLRSWASARAWCQQHYTDMVAIQDQAEVAYLNEMLPFNPNHYWIGIRKVAGVWTWVGTNKSLTAEAENWATGEPNNRYEDCVEMYIGRTMARWNDERCGKTKGTVCYTASCVEGSCSVHADCVEVIGNFSCQCHPGFLSPACEEAVPCHALSDPNHGSLQCNDSYKSYSFNSSCRFHCDLGYHMEGLAWLQCQASGHWDHPAPVCRVEQCPALNRTSDRLLMNCSHPIAPFSFSSTCEFSCEEGFELASGKISTECDHAGRWTADVPTCSVIACTPISPPAAANMTCVDSLAPFSFGSSCSFTCLEGYTMLASNHSTLACLASGQWSQHRPTCTVVQCSGLEAPPHAVVRCQDPIANSSYGSSCTVGCEEGFNLIGSNITQCSAQGRWSWELPVCQALQCRALSAPPHGSLSCSDPHGEFSFSSRCALTCDEGFLANGTTHTECSSLGAWSQEVPRCLALQCRALSAPPHGSLSCSDPHGEFSFSSRCALTCDEGFLPNGTTSTECSSLGAWSQEVPRCLARHCPLLASAPHHGWMNCSHPHSASGYGSRCDLGCSQGFRLRGASRVHCNASGGWSEEMPTCQVARCPAGWLAGLPASPLSFNCSHPLGNFSFTSRCRFSCEGGYSMNGTAELLCSANGLWSSAALPTCMKEGMPLRSAILLYSGGSAVVLLVVLAAVGLGLLVSRSFQKKGILDVNNSFWEETENPAFES